MQKIKVLGIILTTILLVFGYLKTKDFFAVDSCLDKGGRWNYERSECEELKFDPNVLNDKRFSGGHDYETKEAIKPRMFQFDNYTLVTGVSNDNGTSGLGLYYGNKEIFYTTTQDGVFDTVMTANLNNDGVTDYLVSIGYEDGASLFGLTSIAKEKFNERLLLKEWNDAYCIESSDTTKYILPLQIKDINNDGKDDVISNLVIINGKRFPISCTDTAFGE